MILELIHLMIIMTPSVVLQIMDTLKLSSFYLLNDPRVDPSADNNDAICCASDNGQVEVVKLLLNDPRIDPSDDNNRAIR